MGPDLSTQSVLVIDAGLFPFMATMLARSFGTVYYAVPQGEAFPLARRALWGEGLPGVERVEDPFSYVNVVDVICFPDVGQSDLQVYLRESGKAVWGSADAQVLEQDRVAFRRWMAHVGLPTADATILDGMAALRKHMEDPAQTDQFIKLSTYRGESETFQHRNAWLSDPWMTALEHQLGPMAERMTFVAEAEIPDAIEVGYDGFTIDGAFPPLAVVGYENKDTAYLGCVTAAGALPRVLTDVNDALAPVLKAMQARTMLSTEVRVTADGVGYLIDPALRNGSPPSECLTVLFGNWAEIIAAGARDGVVVPPVPVAKYAAQVVLRSAWAEDGFLPLRFPEEYRDRIQLHGHAIVDGTDYVVSLDMDIIGSAVGVGDTPEAAAAEAVAVAESIEAHQLTFDAHGFEVLYERIDEGRKRGVPWG